MSATTSRIYNTTDGPLLIDDEGHVLGARESTRVPSLDVDPITGHLDAGRLVDTTEAKAEGADVLAGALDGSEAAAKTKPGKGANTNTRS